MVDLTAVFKLYESNFVHPAQSCLIAELRSFQFTFQVDDSLAVDAPGLPSIKLTVNDTAPIWYVSHLCLQAYSPVLDF